jgi:3-methyladenine DNA glycosylase AlkD
MPATPPVYLKLETRNPELRARNPEPETRNPEPSSAATTIVALLRAHRSPRDAEGQRHYGISPRAELLGLRASMLRALARQHRRDHELALALWSQPIHEARVLAALIDDPKQVTRGQMEAWARDFDNWAIVDACCTQLFNHTPFAIDQAHAWSRRRAEFVKRGAFSLMAGLAVHAKQLPDEVFLDFLPIIAREATDERNFVKKAVNWALRQIGKRNAPLGRAALATAEEILLLDTPAACWIARDAIRELKNR